MKKLLCVLLVIIMIVSSVITSSAYGWQDSAIITVDEAVKAHEQKTGEKVQTNRYYFLMPNGSNGDLGDDDSVDEFGYPTGHFGEYSESWFTTLSDGSPATNTACIYWWASRVADPPSWVGYLPSGVDANDPCVFYADVPKAVPSIIWNNGVDGGMDTSADIYKCRRQTICIPCEFYDPSESPNYPDGLDSFDNMIFVLDPDKYYSWGSTEYSGEWYYYYGDGCYGFTKDGTKSDCLRHDHFDEAGNHIEQQEIPTEEPTTPQGPIAKIEIEPLTITGGLDGYITKQHDWSTNEDHVYFYYLPERKMEYTITFTDGTTSKGNGEYVYYNGESHRFTVSTGQSYKTPWIDGNEYTMTVSLFDVSVDVPVTIKENPVEKIEFEPVSLIEGLGGYIVTEYEWGTDNEYKYYCYAPDRAMDYTITWKDGRVTQEHGHYVFYKGEYLELNISTDQSYKTQWSGGNTYTMNVSLFGFSEDVPVTLLENPIEKIEIEPITITERTHGRVNTYYDPYKMEKHEYYYYSPLDVMEYTVYFKDGTSASGTGDDYILKFNGQSYAFITDTDQSYENQWMPDHTYSMEATLMGVTLEVPVTIEPRTEFMLGDADLDDNISVLDASLIQLSLVGKREITGIAISAADADRDGKVTVLDASLIQLFLVGKKDIV